MVYWNAEEIQQRELPPGVRHSDKWRNLDIPVWPRNKAPVIGLGLSRWAIPNQSPEAKECWEENGGHFLLKEWSSGNCCARGSEDSYSEMVYRSLSPPSILKNSGEAAKCRTARNSAPLWQTLFPHSQCNNGVSGKDTNEINDSSNLQSRPGTVRHFPVPEREESHAWTPISQPRRWCGCLQWRAKCNVWEQVAWQLPEDAAVYRMCWRVLWKGVIGKETIIVHCCVSQNLSSYLRYVFNRNKYLKEFYQREQKILEIQAYQPSRFPKWSNYVIERRNTVKYLCSPPAPNDNFYILGKVMETRPSCALLWEGGREGQWQCM